MRSYSMAQGTISSLLGYNMMEGNMRKRMYVYVWLGHFALEQKLIQHCKSTVIKKRIGKKFKNFKKEKTFLFWNSPARASAEPQHMWQRVEGLWRTGEGRLILEVTRAEDFRKHKGASPTLKSGPPSHNFLCPIGIMTMWALTLLVKVKSLDFYHHLMVLRAKWDGEQNSSWLPLLPWEVLPSVSSLII